MSFLNEQPGKFIPTAEHQDLLELVAIYLKEAVNPLANNVRQHVFDRKLGQGSRRCAEAYAAADKLARTRANQLMSTPMTPTEIRADALKMKAIFLIARNDFPGDLIRTLAEGITGGDRQGRKYARSHVHANLGFPGVGLYLTPEDPKVAELLSLHENVDLALRMFGILPSLPTVPPEAAAVLEPSPTPPGSLLEDVELQPSVEEESPVLAVSHLAI